MSVHYKFKSAISYDTIAFDGLHISVRDLKKAILHQKQIGKSTDFDLQITNAQSNEVYTDEGALIPKNSSLIVVRVPLTAQQKKAWEKSDATQLHLIGLNKGSSDSPDHILNKFAKSADLTAIDASEEDKIQAAIAQSTLDYDPSNYVRIKGSNQVGEIPPNYRCYKCMQPGHWIKDCKLNAQQDASIEIRKSTGIPRSFMTPVEGPEVPGAMMTPSGQFAIPTIDHEARKEAPKKGGEMLTVEKPSVPDDLLCGVCKDLLTDAVMIPCCGNSFCDDCIRNVLLESEDHQCPDCKEKDVSPDTLIPNRFLRNSVNNFKNQTGYSRVVPLKPPPPPPQKKVETAVADSTAIEPVPIETVVLDPPEGLGLPPQGQHDHPPFPLPPTVDLPEPIEVKDDGDDDCTISGPVIPRYGTTHSSPPPGNAIPSLSGQPIRNLANVYHNIPHNRLNLPSNPNFIPKGEDHPLHMRDHHHFIRRGRGERSGTPTVDEHGNRGYHNIQSLGAPRPLMPPHHHAPAHPPPHIHFSQSGGYVFQPVYRDFPGMDESGRYRGHHYQGRSRSRPSYRPPMPAQHSPPNGNVPPGGVDMSVDKIFEDFMKEKDSRKRDKQRSYSRSYSRSPSPRGLRRSRSPKRSRSRHRSPLGRSPRGRSIERKSGRSRLRSRSRTRGMGRSHSRSKSRSPPSYKRRSRSRSKSPSLSMSSRSRSRSVTSQSGRRSPISSRRRRGRSPPLPPGISPPKLSPPRYYSSKYHSSSNEGSRYKSSSRSTSHYQPRSQDFYPAQEYARYNDRYDTRNISRERSHTKRYEDPVPSADLGNDWERIRDNVMAQIKAKPAEQYITTSQSSSQERHRRKVTHIPEEESEHLPPIREVKEKEKKVEMEKTEKKESVVVVEDKTPSDNKQDHLSDREKTPEKKLKEKKKKKREESDKKKKKRKVKEKADKKEDEGEVSPQPEKVEVKEKIRGGIINLIKPDDLYKDLDASVDMKALENMGKQTNLTTLPSVKTTAEADSSTPKDVMLAPVPELSKWEKDEDLNNSTTDPKSVDPAKKDSSSEETKQVTSEVLKRAENAIFKKSVNPLKPTENKARERKKEPEKKEKVVTKEPIVVEQYLKEPIKPVKSIALPVKTDYDETRSKKPERITVPDKEKPRISAKERLGAKVDEIVIKRNFGASKGREVKSEIKVDKVAKIKEIKRVDTTVIHRDHRDRRENRKVSVRKKDDEHPREKTPDKKRHPSDDTTSFPNFENSGDEKEAKEEKKSIVPPVAKKRSSSEENVTSKKLKSSHHEESSADSSDDSVESIKKKKKKKKSKKKKKKRSKKDSSSDLSDSSSSSSGSDSEDNRKKRKHKSHKSHKKSKKQSQYSYRRVCRIPRHRGSKQFYNNHTSYQSSGYGGGGAVEPNRENIKMKRY